MRVLARAAAALAPSPCRAQLLAFREYRASVLAGASLSVGGLSESVVKQASGALLDWMKHLRAARRLADIADIGRLLVSQFSDGTAATAGDAAPSDAAGAAGDGDGGAEDGAGSAQQALADNRVLLPLLKTLTLLLANDMLTPVAAPEHGVLAPLMDALAATYRKVRAARRLCCSPASATDCVHDAMQGSDAVRLMELAEGKRAVASPAPSRVPSYTLPRSVL